MQCNLNSKNEYFKEKIKRRGLNNEEMNQQCGICSQTFKCMSDVQEHEQLFHTRIQCESCDYKSFGEKDLTSHKTNLHMQ